MNHISAWFKKYFIPHKSNDHQPHFLRHESMLFLLLIIIIIELGFLIQVFVVFNRTSYLASVLPGILQTLTNEERVDNGVAPLVENPVLDMAAQMKADDMATLGYFAHTSPEGKTPWYWFEKAGYRYALAGENLAVNFFESKDVANAWMNSPTHRANIIKKEYTEIGFGIATGTYQGRITTFVVQEFGTPMQVNAQVSHNPNPFMNGTEANPVKNVPIPKTVNIVKPVKIFPQKVINVKSTPVKPKVVSTFIPEPNTIRILGDETNKINYTDTTGVIHQASIIRNSIQKIMTSPMSYINYIYGFIGAIIILVIVFGLFVRSEIQHPAVIIRGTGLVAVIIFLFILNLTIVPHQVDLPKDSFSATVVAN